jgi:ArsR family transcriptional regulator
MTYSEELMQQRSHVLKALANVTRLRILNYLCHNGESCVCKITPALGLEQSNISQHLAILRDAGILGSRKEGIKVLYWIRDNRVCRIMETLDELLLEQLREQEKILSGVAKKKR